MLELVKWLTLALVFLLGPMLLIHELGHFISGKLAGVRVLEFGFGFPPRLFVFAREKGELVVDGLRMTLPSRLKIPKGLEPMHNVEVLAQREEEGSYRATRIAQSVGAPGREETADGLRVRGSLTVLEPGTRYSLNLLPMGAFVRLLGEEDPSHPRSLAAQSKRWRLTVLLSGVLLNLLSAWLIMTAAYMTGVPDRYFVEIDSVVPDTAAETAGLQAGDVIVAFNGERLQDGPGDLRERILAVPEEAVTLEVVRDDETLAIPATPGTVDGQGYLGIAMRAWPDAQSAVRYSFFPALGAAGHEFVDLLRRVFSLPRMLEGGEIQPSDIRPVALPGILQWLGLSLKQSVEWGLAFPALHLTAMISFAIGLTNLLPLPGLDGGRALFVLIEALRGRRVSPMVEATVHMIGLAILIVLSVFIIIQDIVNPIIDWSLF
ncbi:MAG: site-2 protease family protein [Anaerolineae bacterium]|nr:site-2 protease family protein [Anaerolineae bacterium]